ncbi:MAG: hypothetical protein ACSHWN_10110 [Methylophilaceae bacterium]
MNHLNKDFQPIEIINAAELAEAMEEAMHTMVQALYTGTQRPKLYMYQRAAVDIAVETFNTRVNAMLKQHQEKVMRMIAESS